MTLKWFRLAIMRHYLNNVLAMIALYYRIASMFVANHQEDENVKRQQQIIVDIAKVHFLLDWVVVCQHHRVTTVDEYKMMAIKMVHEKLFVHTYQS